MAYKDKYGVEYSDDKETLVRCPENFEGELIIPEYVEMIKPDAFVGCTKLTSVVFPKHFGYINDHLFDGCMGLMIAEIPYGKKYSLTWKKTL